MQVVKRLNSYYAKPKAIRIATITKETTLKQLAKDVSTHYQTIVNVAGGKQPTSELRAKAIANQLDVEVEDIFEVGKR